jgi:autotransporter translocation and assembly factor TamB
VFEELRVTAGGQSLAIGGGVGSEGFDDLVFDARALDLESLGALVGSPVKLGGQADAHLELRGRFASPSATGRVEWQSPELGTTRLDGMTLNCAATQGVLRIDAAFRGAGRTLLDARLGIPQAPLELSIWELAASPLLAIDLSAAQLDLSLLDPLRSFGLPRLRGVLDGQLRFVGGASFPEQASLTLRAKRLSVGDAVPVDLELGIADRGQGWLAVEQLRIVRDEDSFEAIPGARVRLENREISFDGLELLAHGQRVRLSGGVGLQGFDGLRIEAQGLDVAALADAALDVTGRLDTKVELRGPFAKPALNGTVRWSEARVVGVPVDELVLDLQTVDSRIHATGTVRREGRPVVQGNALLPPEPLAGGVPLLASSELEVELRASHLELALLEPWLFGTFREPRGTVEGWLRLRGGHPRPRFEGLLDLQNGSLSVPVLGRTLAPIAGSLSLHSDSLRIDTLRVGPPGNDAVLTGTLGIDEAGTPRADLRLALREFPLAQTGFARANTSGAVEVAGPLDGLRVRGEMALSEVLVRLPEPQDPTLKEIRVLVDPTDMESLRESREPFAGFVGQADVDLGLTVPEGSRIRGQGADLQVDGEIRLRKPRLAPAAYAGLLRAQRGSYRFRGRRFELRRGSATFDGRPVPDPLLDIEAAHRVKDVTVVARITGRASDPTVRLRSEPELPEKDVLAYLLFGRSSDQVASSQQAALQSAAAGLAAGLALTEVETVLGRDLPVESVDIRVEEDGSLGELGVSGRLTERLSVRYGRTLGVDSEDQVGAEIRLAPRWSLQSDVTSSGNAGADLIWNLDY